MKFNDAKKRFIEAVAALPAHVEEVQRLKASLASVADEVRGEVEKYEVARKTGMASGQPLDLASLPEKPSDGLHDELHTARAQALRAYREGPLFDATEAARVARQEMLQSFRDECHTDLIAALDTLNSIRAAEDAIDLERGRFSNWEIPVGPNDKDFHPGALNYLSRDPKTDLIGDDIRAAISTLREAKMAERI